MWDPKNSLYIYHRAYYIISSLTSSLSHSRLSMLHKAIFRAFLPSFGLRHVGSIKAGWVCSLSSLLLQVDLTAQDTHTHTLFFFPFFQCSAVKETLLNEVHFTCWAVALWRCLPGDSYFSHMFIGFLWGKQRDWHSISSSEENWTLRGSLATCLLCQHLIACIRSIYIRTWTLVKK